MTAMVQYSCAFLGFIMGFITGLAVLAHITRGEKMRELLGNKDKKLWLGAFGWFFAFIGLWVGWQLSTFALQALGY